MGTESCGIPLYLVEKYGPTTLRVAPDEPDFAAYLNWITHADATLTFPQTVYLRFVLQEPQNKLQKAGEAYAKWFFARLHPDPLIKAQDCVKVDIASGKITDYIKFESGNVCMVTGGRNLGRVGIIMHREKHPGSFDIVHVKDAAGHSFATRLNY